MDGVGIFGHINSIGPGLSAFWRKADLGYIHNSFEEAKLGKILILIFKGIL